MFTVPDERIHLDTECWRKLGPGDGSGGEGERPGAN